MWLYGNKTSLNLSLTGQQNWSWRCCSWWSKEYQQVIVCSGKCHFRFSRRNGMFCWGKKYVQFNWWKVFAFMFKNKDSLSVLLMHTRLISVSSRRLNTGQVLIFWVKSKWAFSQRIMIPDMFNKGFIIYPKEHYFSCQSKGWRSTKQGPSCWLR